MSLTAANAVMDTAASVSDRVAGSAMWRETAVDSWCRSRTGSIGSRSGKAGSMCAPAGWRIGRRVTDRPRRWRSRPPELRPFVEGPIVAALGAALGAAVGAALPLSQAKDNGRDRR